MRAENDYWVEVVVNDEDFALVDEDNQLTYWDKGAVYTTLNGQAKDLFEYVGDLDFVDEKDLGTSKIAVDYTVYKHDGSNTEEVDDSVLFNNNVYYNYTVEVTFEIDYLKDGYEVGKTAKGDGVDDREQTIYSIKEEGWSDRTKSGTGEYSKAVKYVADSEEVLEDLIEALPGYAASRVVDKTVYRRVYYVNGTNVTADWEKDPSDRIVFGSKKAETPVYDELDTNHDGVVSCDEAHGEGWVWNEDKKACVYTGSTTSTVIVNTATK